MLAFPELGLTGIEMQNGRETSMDMALALALALASAFAQGNGSPHFALSWGTQRCMHVDVGVDVGVTVSVSPTSCQSGLFLGFAVVVTSVPASAEFDCEPELRKENECGPTFFQPEQRQTNHKEASNNEEDGDAEPVPTNPVNLHTEQTNNHEAEETVMPQTVPPHQPVGGRGNQTTGLFHLEGDHHAVRRFRPQADQFVARGTWPANTSDRFS